MREFKPDAIAWGAANAKWITAGAITLVVVLIVALGGFEQVEAGHMGVKTRFGDVVGDALVAPQAQGPLAMSCSKLCSSYSTLGRGT